MVSQGDSSSLVQGFNGAGFLSPYPSFNHQENLLNQITSRIYQQSVQQLSYSLRI